MVNKSGGRTLEEVAAGVAHEETRVPDTKVAVMVVSRGQSQATLHK